jgi:ABC-type branched-subunit amino acid transport system permease subunit
MVVVILLLNVLTFHALYTSRIGRAWAAIGSSARLAEVQGVNVYRYRLASSVIGCFFAGVIGSFYAHYQNLLIPTTFSFHCSIYVQMYSLIGGLSYYIAGPIVGAVVMVFCLNIARRPGVSARLVRCAPHPDHHFSARHLGIRERSHGCMGFSIAPARLAKRGRPWHS